MRKRRAVNKRRSVRNFKKATRRTRRINIISPMRGGIRL